MSFQITLARDLGLPPPQAAIEIDRYLIALPTNCTLAGGNGRCMRNDPNASWVSYSNATVKTSGDFSLYPVWPTELVSIGSGPELRRTARRTIKTFVASPSQNEPGSCAFRRPYFCSNDWEFSYLQHVFLYLFVAEHVPEIDCIGRPVAWSRFSPRNSSHRDRC